MSQSNPAVSFGNSKQRRDARLWSAFDENQSEKNHEKIMDQLPAPGPLRRRNIQRSK